MNQNFNNKEILLVEDEPSIAEAIEFVLDQEGFEVNYVCLISEAREVLKSKKIDFIILDIGLPDGNGLEFCKEIRTESDVPILFLTARQEEVDRIVGLEIGADDYVTKPFSSRELSARVKTILRRSQGSYSIKETSDDQINSQSEILDYSIDNDRREISFKTLKLELTKNEYELLAFLINNPGRVYSRTQLMEAVWEEPESAFERTVDAHIKSIRKKVGDDCNIKTHRGFGYSLEQV